MQLSHLPPPPPPPPAIIPTGMISPPPPVGFIPPPPPLLSSLMNSVTSLFKSSKPQSNLVRLPLTSVDFPETPPSHCVFYTSKSPSDSLIEEKLKKKF